MSPGEIILLDKYDEPPWPGCNLAADEFLSDQPESVAGIAGDYCWKYYNKQLS
jgi:hypothetical protein